MWKQIDIADGYRPFLKEGDLCYYTREFISHGGYAASEANQLISNFKKTVDRKGKSEWYYKEKSIEQFSEEIASSISAKCIITYIPTSKHKSDPQYDSRMEETCRKVVLKNKLMSFEEPIVVKNTIEASHCGGTRNVRELSQNYEWIGFSQKPDCPIVLIDDVLTKGAHFRACKDLILHHYNELSVVGLFWAKAVYPDNTDDTDIDF